MPVLIAGKRAGSLSSWLPSERLSLRMPRRGVKRRAVMIIFSFPIAFVWRDAELATLTKIIAR